VESVVGLGTEFSVYLPLAASATGGDPASVRASQAAQVHPQGDACILLVEDEPGVRRSTARMLQRHGYRIIEAENADQALALWNDIGDSVDLLLTDIVMPGSLNGHALAKQLGALRPGLRILLMSGYDPTQLAARSLGGATPVAPILTKPFSIDELLGMVRARLEQPVP
jgi:DNA-binding NtrC family response regulator